MTDVWNGHSEQSVRETCVTCGTPLNTPYCSSCGERRAADRRYSVIEFGHEALEHFLSFDGRALRTFSMLLRKPGELTAAFMRGMRLPYLTPLHCFLVANLIYFVWATFTGSDTFATRLAVHTHGVPYAAAARRAVSARLASTGEDPTAFATRFDAIGRTQAKSLVVVMVPVFAVLVGVATVGRRRRYVVQHLAFAFHTYAFIFCLSIVATYAIGWPLAGIASLVGHALSDQRFDDVFSLILVALLLAYNYSALRRAYEIGKARAGLTAVILTGGIAVILALYRGLLFVVTFASV